MPNATGSIPVPKLLVLPLAIHAILSPSFAQAAENDSGSRLEEIIVTATKSRQSIQDTSLSVMAMPQSTLDELDIENLDDYVAYLPNVTAAGRGPGQSEVYIRGLSTVRVAIGSNEVSGSVPNVAMYVDEQPVTQGGRNLDVYVTDIERIEVLPGPQGTIYGASSQAGTIRLITNKPNTGEWEFRVDTRLAYTAHGEPSNSVEAVINIPLVEDKFALRAAVYSINRGGYIDNVPGEYRNFLDAGFAPPGADIQSVNNNDLAEKDFNDVSYDGIRVGALFNISSDWDLLVQHTHQELQVDGVFDHDPEEFGDLQVQRFMVDRLDDDFDLTTVTLSGRIANLDVIYAGGYLDRQSFQSVDYSGYVRIGGFVPYYVCDYPAYTECGDARYGGLYSNEFTRTTHELRLSTPQDKRIRAIAGVFFDDAEILHDAWSPQPGSAFVGFAQNAPIAGTTMVNPNPRPLGITFVNDITRGEEQFAVFGEVTLDVVPNLFSISGGIRNYDLDVFFAGSSNFANRGVDGDFGRNIDQLLDGLVPRNESDTIVKATVTLTPRENLLFYSTYSEGFRPGGFNRVAPPLGSNAPVDPSSYETDTLENYELGWKTTLFDGKLRFNGAIFSMDWGAMQIGVIEPSISRVTFVANIGDAELRGLEADFTYVPTDNLTVMGAISFMDTELTSIDVSGTNLPAQNLSPVGSELTLAPSFQGNVRVRYQWDLNGRDAHAQLGVIHTGEQYNSLLIRDRKKQDSWTTMSGSLGLQNDNWYAEVFVENLTDERAELFINVMDVDERITTNRPRTIGVRLSYSF